MKVSHKYMKAIIPQLVRDHKDPMYLQLYRYIRDSVLNNEFASGEKLPSIRNLSQDLKISVTTTNLAYQQLLVEGYIESKPQSGYYINNIKGSIQEELSQGIRRMPPNNNGGNPSLHDENSILIKSKEENSSSFLCDKNDNSIPHDGNDNNLLHDENTFDFVKWKKCLTNVLNEHSRLLFYDGDPQGEYSLRHEISKYLYRIKGIGTNAQNIVIGAGTQQITGQLSRLLLMDEINDLIIEQPGYYPAHNIFKDYGFDLLSVPVNTEGIAIDKIPKDTREAIYISPSNHFPTGAVIPIGKRYELLDLAQKNDSYIIEDDYDSELRYFGKPIPPLRSLDENNCVVYLSSFSSTLFPAIKISYMVLPPKLLEKFKDEGSIYTQTCSKTEQLALALYMQKGFYYTNVKKVRRLYSQKLQTTINAFKKYVPDFIKLIHSSSGVNMLIEVRTDKSPSQLHDISRQLGISTEILEDNENNKPEYPRLILHFHLIPLNKIESTIEKWLTLLRA